MPLAAPFWPPFFRKCCEMFRISQRPHGEKLGECVAKFPPFRNTQKSGGNLAVHLLNTTRMSKISVAAPRQGAAPLYDPFVHIAVGTVKRSSQRFSNFFSRSRISQRPNWG